MARDKMDRGELPRVNPQRIWVQAGTWERCALCSSAITESETAYELQFALRLVSFSFHAACYAAWLAECTQPSAGAPGRRRHNRAPGVLPE
jgi:hypothetical protein